MTAEQFTEHLIESHLGDVDAIVVAQSGQVEAPEGWELESITYCNGKRIRKFRMKTDD